jgi:hypothetical protein
MTDPSNGPDDTSASEQSELTGFNLQDMMSRTSQAEDLLNAVQKKLAGTAAATISNMDDGNSGGFGRPESDDELTGFGVQSMMESLTQAEETLTGIVKTLGTEDIRGLKDSGASHASAGVESASGAADPIPAHPSEIIDEIAPGGRLITEPIAADQPDITDHIAPGGRLITDPIPADQPDITDHIAPGGPLIHDPVQDVGLNPQPQPPSVSLNPQPEPPSMPNDLLIQDVAIFEPSTEPAPPDPDPSLAITDFVTYAGPDEADPMVP